MRRVVQLVKPLRRCAALCNVVHRRPALCKSPFVLCSVVQCCAASGGVAGQGRIGERRVVEAVDARVAIGDRGSGEP